jgi:asparagine synthase (glutamine-hydrolysing)
MCGLTGFWSPEGRPDDAAALALVSKMRDRISHRGPDDAGNWRDPGAGVTFGFRRLSIIDLSPAGHQPMLSADGRYVVMMNGEIYNFADMRAEIDAARGGHAWRGHSDTEVLVEAIAAWGVSAAIGRANGMFALAIWDRRDRVLSLARDRIGKKPLYYGWAGRSFLFGSELKALRAYPGFDDRICPEALSGFLQIGYVAGGRTIFSAISKLPGGHVLHLDAESAARRLTPAPVRYWDLHGIAMAGLDAQAGGKAAHQDEFEALVQDAVARRMVADVPVGSFLSGGIDSSLVTAVMAQDPGRPVHSFAIGFKVPEWDEAPHARAVAAHLGTRHEELYVGANEILDMVRRVAEICDEPLADDSIVPTTLLCRLARRGVVVALSGDGGDELFGGYARYAAVDAWLARAGWLPRVARLATGIISDGLAGPVERAGYVRGGRRLRLLGSLMTSGDADEAHRMLVSQTLDADALLAEPVDTPHPLDHPAYTLGRSTPVDRMGFMDMASYLTDDILTKVDRASMSASLEVRCPLLDYRVIEASWRFPPEAKYRDGEGKRPLRTMLARYVPRTLTDRPKRGFGAPVEVWLRHELRDWAEALMGVEALGRHGLLNVEACRRLWTDFQQRGHSFNRVIWNLLMFQAWHEALRQAPVPAAVWVPPPPLVQDAAEAARHSAAK